MPEDRLQEFIAMPFIFKIIKNHKNLVYGLSEKADGGMSRAIDHESNKQGYQNRIKFLSKYQVDIGQTKIAGLTHSAKVFLVGPNHGSQVVPDTDGLITADKNVYLTVTVADCFPVFLFDPKNSAVGLVHAGWRGIVKGIITNAVSRMKQDGVDPKKLLAGIGPGINPCHFEIQTDIVPQFEHYQSYILRRDNKIFADLTGIIRQQLLENGLESANIEISGECTYCSKEKYFSFRRDKQLTPMLAFIGFR